ncbi:argininosuccinate synthase [Halothermothrix orenii]|uniref:Argininosuccinate synthase n=1 Tax=Halothermothrix orenii (strain H 168 / OCM 544 / DSM 9562) TaxID=373903 RepID=B8D1H4_HALOH|nr:argininosuccinate synthase [Halothermothrix orenii]ACL69051.1 Argininosuccinate synthase [Halothermothrix orenii H 168]
MKKVNKIVLAYSGGLDTSVSIKWLQEKFNAEIIAYSANVGQDDNDWNQIKEKALKAGASKVYIDDIREEFIKNYAFNSLKANGLYEGKYPLATALSRPLIAKRMVEVAHQEGAEAVAHGCTGKGNDQVRFDVSFKALDPDLEIIAPLREWEFKSRGEEIDYAKKHNIPVKATKESPYSIDSNLWGLSVECGELEDPWAEPPLDAYQWTANPEEAPATPLYLTISFDQGEPIKLNDRYMSPVELVEKLNDIGAEYGIGRIDMVENRLVGIKSREIYETPAATILLEAHQQLEDLTLDRETAHYKRLISEKYSELVYNGLWYSPLRSALEAFIEDTQKQVTGKVKLKLYKGQCVTVGRKSPYSLYQFDLATYDENDSFDHSSAKGFIKLWGLPGQVYSQVQQKNKDTIYLKEFVK